MHTEAHLIARIGWLRAAVLGANDGIISTASLILGVASATASQANVLLAGTAGLVAGAMSMAAGEYVSVSSQSDTENADLARERRELADDSEFEKRELANIYVSRGVEPSVAQQVAEQLMAKDALGAHARDELGISEVTTARPVQAALASAATFSVGAAAPLALALVSPSSWRIPTVSLGFLGVSRPAWHDRCQSRRGKRSEANHSRDVLGRARDGSDGWNRCHLWHRHLIGTFGAPCLDNSVSFSASAG
jgi:VIT1/CCC1 family predicted Fe2+/Mn2+ transporter